MDIHRKIFIAYKKSNKFSLLLEIYKSLNLRIPHFLSHVYIKDHYNNIEDSFIRLLEKSTIQKYFRSMLSTYSKMLVGADERRIISILSNMCYIFEQDLVLNEMDEGRIYRIVMELTDRFFDEDTLEVSEQTSIVTTDELKFWLLRLLKNIRIYFHDEREFLILKYLDSWDETDTSKLLNYLKDDLSDNLPLLHKVLMQDNAGFDPEIYEMLVSLYKERIFGPDNMFDQQFFDSLVLKDNMNGKYRNLHHIKTENEMNKPRSSCNRHIKLMIRQKFTKKMNYRILQDCIKLIQKRYGLSRIPELARYSIENLRSIGENRIEEYIKENRTAIIEDLSVNKVEILAKVLRTDNFTKSIIFDLFDVKKIVKKHYNELISSASQAISDSELQITDQTAITKEYRGIKTYQFIENIGVGNYEVVDNKKLGTIDSLPTSFGSNTSIDDLNNLILSNNVKRLAIRVDYDYGVIRKVFNIHKSVKITGVLLEGPINFDYLILLNDAVTSKILRRRSLNGLFYKLLYSELTGKSLVLKYRILSSLIQQYREMDIFIVENNLHDVKQRGIKKLSCKNGNIQKKAANDKKMYKKTDNLDINEDNTEILSVKIWDEVQVFEIEEIPYILELLIACINNTKKGFLLRRIEAKIEHYISLHSCYFYGRDMHLFFKFLESILRYDLKNKKLLSKIFDFLLEYEQEEILNVLYEHNRTFFLYLCAEEYYKVKLLISSDDICDFMELSRALALQRNTFIASVNMFYKVLVSRPEMKSNVLKCAVILLSCKIMENFRGLSFIVEAAGNHFNVEPDRDDITLMEMDISEVLNFDYKYVDYYTYCGSKTLLITRDKSMLVYVFSFLTDCCFLPLLTFFRKKDVVFACIFLALKVLKSDIFKCGENAGPGIDQEVAAAMTLGMKISTDESSLDSTPVIQDIAIENKRRKLFYKNTRKAHKLKEKLFKKYRPHLRIEPEFLHDLEMAFKGFEYSAVEIHFICKELLDFYAKML